MYQVLSLKIEGNRHHVQLHRFKYECFYASIIPDGYEIDYRIDKHDDDGLKNNGISNLQCLKKADHRRKTQKDNPQIGAKIAETVGKSGRATRSYDAHCIIFTSIKDLARRTNRCAATWQGWLKTRSGAAPAGYDIIEFDSPETMPDEEWKLHPSMNVEVSDMGRIKDRFGRTTRGSENDSGYFQFSQRQVSNMVLETFVGPKPTPLHTADHKNRNTSDNRLINLRWATKAEQARNKSCNETVVQYNGFTGEMTQQWTCKQDAICDLGIDFSMLERVTSRRRNWFVVVGNQLLNARRIRFVSSSLHPGCFTCPKDESPRLIMTPSKFFANRKNTIKCFSPSAKQHWGSVELFLQAHRAANIIKCHVCSLSRFKTYPSKQGSP